MTASLSITHDPTELTSDDAITSYMDYQEGFRYSIQDIALKPSEFKDFVKDLETEFGPISEYDYSRNKNQMFKKMQNAALRCYFRGNSMDVFGTVYASSEAICQHVWKTYIKYSKKDDNIDIYVHSFFMNNNQLDDSTKLLKGEDLNYISAKYYPYIDTQVMFDQFFTGAENILLIVGEPGLGKSKLSTLAIKHALNNTDKLPYDKLAENPALDNQHINVAFIKSTDVLVNDKFWRKLEALQADIVVIDDLDYMLTKRDSEVQTQEDDKKNTFLNQFLSYTDGVEKHKTKFIITTNQSYVDIDSALLRKGRLFDILELRRLDRAECIGVWKDNGLSEEAFDEVFKTHEILPADLGSEINKRMNSRIETATQSYLKEEGISKVQRAGRSKQIGL